MMVTLGAWSIGDVDWWGLATLLLTGLVIAWVSGVAFVRWSLRNPPRRTYGSALARSQPGTPMELDAARFGVGPRAFQEWRLERPCGKGWLPVWEIAGDSSEGPTVILTHGWGDGRVGGLLRLEPFLCRASRVLLWDLPGHGDAPREAGVCALGRAEGADLEALIERTRGPVVLMGWSLGAGVSIVAARHPRVIGVVCEAPYTLPQVPASRVMASMGLQGFGVLRSALVSIGGLAWLRRSGWFDRAVRATEVKVPLLVLHGEHDPVCPLSEGERIAAAGSGELVTLPGGRHNDLWIKTEYRSVCCLAVARWWPTMAASGSGPASEASDPTP